MDLVIGLDSGTTATKAVAVAADATVIATSSVGYPLLVPEPGYAELDPVRLQTAAVEAVAEVVTEVRQRGDRVVGLCLSAAMHGLVPLDGAGSPTGPLITWADSRAGEESRSLADSSRGQLHKRTGTPVHPMSPLPKLLWWRLHHPDAFASTPKWGGVKEVVLSGLCEDAYLIDLSCASTTGLYDITARQWDPEALQLAGIDAGQLATVVPTTHVVTGLRSEVADQTGLPRDLPVVVGASDGPLANLGLGAVSEGVAAVSLGTSGAIRAVRPAPAVDQAARLFCYALTDDHWVLGGAINNAGSVVRWASAALGMVTDDVQGEERGRGRRAAVTGGRGDTVRQRRAALPALSAGRTGPLVGAWAAGGLDRNTSPSPPRTSGACGRRGRLHAAGIGGAGLGRGRRARAGGARHWWGDGVAGVA